MMIIYGGLATPRQVNLLPGLGLGTVPLGGRLLLFLLLELLLNLFVFGVFLCVKFLNS